ncbi:hypothetical protein IQ260_11050 [Leptolyngbya cf. ectocarpi LEGE 11479]|uniref:Uncharacterized protein n=1 Tax=Leptolyngbya cf. ectocarpi LEGE 11479 TaxID=1828722 RepID=A0A928X5F0_LEPEC|nr:hypothetical protein [Leptolyngbya ectocarpi]MBE9067193.1 hypothetical protein [Leptolyngbya cf. ectocarpi LEGE 11479]
MSERKITVHGGQYVEIVGSGNQNNIANNHLPKRQVLTTGEDLSLVLSEIQALLEKLINRDGLREEEAQQQMSIQIADEARKDLTVRKKLLKWSQSLASSTASDVVKGIVKLACQSVGIPL